MISLKLLSSCGHNKVCFTHYNSKKVKRIPSISSYTYEIAENQKIPLCFIVKPLDPRVQAGISFPASWQSKSFPSCRVLGKITLEGASNLQLKALSACSVHCFIWQTSTLIQTLTTSLTTTPPVKQDHEPIYVFFFFLNPKGERTRISLALLVHHPTRWKRY